MNPTISREKLLYTKLLKKHFRKLVYCDSAEQKCEEVPTGAQKGVSLLQL